MNAKYWFTALLIAVSMLLANCGPSEQELATQIGTSVAATVTAIPTSTLYPTSTSYPTPTPFPTYTPYPTSTRHPTLTPFATYTPYPTPEPQMADLTNLFCEYDFCIGHPARHYLTDPGSLDEMDEWNDYEFGLLIGIDDGLMLLDWVLSTKADWDAPFEAQDTLYEGEMPAGEVVEETVGDLGNLLGV